MEVSLSSTLPDIIRGIAGKFRTISIGRIVAFSHTSGRAEVLPLINSLNGLKLKKLTDVPVLQQKGLSSGLAKGDIGLLLFAERSTDEVLASGKQESPADPRRFHLSDAFFLPLVVLNSAVTGARYSDAVELFSQNGSRICLRNCKVAIGTDAAELLNILSTVLNSVITTFTALVAAGAPPTETAKIAAELVKLQSIAGTL